MSAHWPHWPHMAAVLAGGRSRRMGVTKATLALPNDATMIETVARTLGQLATGVVTLGPPGLLPGAIHVADLRDDQGPLGGLEALLASGLDTTYLVCPCDVPLVSTTLLERLTADVSATAIALRIEGESQPRPLPLRIDADALAIVRRQLDAGRRALHELVSALEPHVIEVPASCGEELVNVNTEADYQAVCMRIGRDEGTQGQRD